MNVGGLWLASWIMDDADAHEKTKMMIPSLHAAQEKLVVFSN